jgi:glycosyltransferase involved in cell wall biosynthesis
MCTYNGAQYLNEQLISIANQSYKNWYLYISDDGSTDHTMEILLAFQSSYSENRVVIFEGSKQGATKNFLSLAYRVHQQCDYFAFCDQDDIWHKDKLYRAIKFLDSFIQNCPSFYCSSTTYINLSGDFLQGSYTFKKAPSFKNALVQSIAGGNTMVFNKAAASLLAKTPFSSKLEAHDWWLYILTTGCGGQVYYDPESSVSYRQHSGALVGENRSLRAKYARIKKALNGRFRMWNDENIQALSYLVDELTNENRITLSWFRKFKSKSLLTRVYAFFYSDIRRQSFWGNVALFIGLVLKKI